MPPSPIRVFIAIELPHPVQADLEAVAKQLRAAGAVAVRWMPVMNIHLTLKFLGDTLPDKLEDLSSHLQSLAARHPPFDVTVGRSGAFPNSKNPRVIWVGLQAPAELGALQQSVESAATLIGSPPEERRFSPHLTLGRVQKNASPAELEAISAALTAVKVAELGRFQAAGFTLFRSDLRPAGSIYTPLAQFKLAG